MRRPSPREPFLAARAYRGEHSFRLELVEVPELRGQDVLVRVEAAGLSRGMIGLWQFTDLIDPLPATLGHEIAGVVEECGPEVHGVRAGARVRVHAPLNCGRCEACRAGAETACESLSIIGYARYGRGPSELDRYRDGGLARYVLAPAASLDPLPDGICADVGCKLGTIAISYRAVALAAGRGELLVVTGASGASGSAAAAVAPFLGFSEVVAVATNQTGLTRLRERCPVVSATVATSELGPGWQTRDGLTEALLAATGGRRPAALVDFTPFGEHVTTQALRALAPLGRAVLVAGNPSLLTLRYVELMGRQLEIAGCSGATRADVGALSRLVAGGRLRLDAFVTHRYALPDVNAALEAIAGRKDDPMLVVVHP